MSEPDGKGGAQTISFQCSRHSLCTNKQPLKIGANDVHGRPDEGIDAFIICVRGVSLLEYASGLERVSSLLSSTACTVTPLPTVLSNLSRMFATYSWAFCSDSLVAVAVIDPVVWKLSAKNVVTSLSYFVKTNTRGTYLSAKYLKKLSSAIWIGRSSVKEMQYLCHIRKKNHATALSLVSRTRYNAIALRGMSGCHDIR